MSYKEYKKKRNQWHGFDLIVAKKLVKLHQSADSRSLEFNLSFNTVKRLLSQKTCYYTGEPMYDEEGPNQRTIDRVDSSLGYVEGNVVACTKHINSLKGSLSWKEIKMLHDGYRRHTFFITKLLNLFNVKLLSNGREDF